MKYTIKTDIFKDGRIIQELSRNHLGVEEIFMRDVWDTKEKQVEKALIELGWTPPKT